MNRIQAKYEKSKYSKEPHLTINVDGNSLDKILHELYPDKNIIGLVPTILDCLEDPKERKLVWERFESEQKQVVPILMCPDDIYLWCTVINVEIEKTVSTVEPSNPSNLPYTYLFPNPSSSNLELLNHDLVEKILIYSITGELMKFIDHPSRNVDVGNLKGIYLVTFILKNGTKSKQKLLIH
ncbi:MAG: T9SS type A sorting domain-containing protein [Lewinellaceae bacterium]|nr:T9SS type A sorting domain-containing protein [Lewinellaceae bacterium]